MKNVRLLSCTGLALVAIGSAGASTAGASTSVVRAAADASVSAAHPAARLGRHPGLRLRFPVERAALRFRVRRVDGAVRRATLRLYARTSGAGLRVWTLRDGGRWSDRTASFRRVRQVGRRVGGTGRFRRGRWLSIDVTRAVRGAGDVKLVVEATRGSALLGSRESGAAPRLRIRTQASSPGSGGTGTAGGGAAPPPSGPVTPVEPPEPPPSVFVAPGGDDADPCTQAAPCATLDRAYHVAALGQVVEVAAGDYPDQDLSADPSKEGTGAGTVIIRSAPGAAVTLGHLDVNGSSNVTLKRIAVAGKIWVENTDASTPGSHDVTLQAVTAPTFRIVGRVSGISILGGSFGDTVDDQPQIKKNDPRDPDEARPSGVLIDGASFHDFRRSAEGVHTECLQILQSDSTTIRNSRFNGCDGTADIGVTDGPHDGLTIENDFLGKAGDAPFVIQLTKNSRNVVIRNNSASKAMIFSDDEQGGPWLLQGNYFPFNPATCTSGATYRHNVFAGGTCGPTDVEVAAMQFVDEHGFDLHLAPRSAAIDRGDPSDYPARDIDGQARPAGAAPDAGADEAG